MKWQGCQISVAWLMLSWFTSSHAAAIPRDPALDLNHTATPFLSDDDFPTRNPPIEFGDPLLGHGKISTGSKTEFGAVVNPSLWIFGEGRIGIQQFMNKSGENGEIPARLDLFANLQLTGTERILLGVQPLHRRTDFTRLVYFPEHQSRFVSELNPTITTLFFEGDLGEIFPGQYKTKQHGGDIGFSIGRQPLVFQDGAFVNDVIDSVGITQNSLSSSGLVNALVTLYFGFHNIDRHNFVRDKDAKLFGLHSRLDLPVRTVDVDVAYLPSTHSNLTGIGGDLLGAALSTIEHFGSWGVTLRSLASYAPKIITGQAEDGLLFFLESNRDVGEHHDIFYVNSALGLGRYTSMARDPTQGGPLGRVGILFASPGLGSLGSALNSQAYRTFSAAMGYQHFFNLDWQASIEVGGRHEWHGSKNEAIGIAARVEHGINARTVWRTEAFVAEPRVGSTMYGLRSELLVKI